MLKPNLGIKRLIHTSFFSNDLRKVIEFYCDILNFKIVHMFINKSKNNELYGLFIHIGDGTMLEFFKTRKRFLSNKSRHVCFEVKNIKKLKKYLETKIKCTNLIRGNSDGTLNFSIKDLENNEIEFHQYDRKSKIFKFIR
jgi:catechol 2,3-dioxygenase-like lactoylglutathione lyase family enzyme